MRITSHLFWLIIFLGAAAFAQEEHSESAFDAEHACLHMEEGPVTALQASEEAAAGPSSEGEHVRLDVSLPTRGGFFGYTAEEAGDFVFLSDAEVSLVIVDGAGERAPEITFNEVAGCDLGVQAFVFDLAAGEHVFRVSEAQGGQVRFVVEAYEHEHGEHEGGESGG